MQVRDWDKQADGLAMTRKAQGEELWMQALSALLPRDRPLRMLDAGCGTGFLSVILAGLGHQVIGIDLSPVMVQCAYETASAAGRRIQFRIMDCAQTDFEDESFDAVVCCELMPYVQDESAVWQEFRRILKREGHVILFDVGSISASKAVGFSHCRPREFAGLGSWRGGESLRCMSARKPARDEQPMDAHIVLFKRQLQTARKQIQLYQNWCQSKGLSYAEYRVLNTISRHPKGSRPSDLSAALVIAPQTLTRILAGLENKGYIARAINEKDRRSTVVTLTAAGAQRMEPLQEALGAIERKALAKVSVDELARAGEISDRLLHELQAAFSAEGSKEEKGCAR